MRSANYIIVEVDEAYNNEKKVGDVSIVVNSTIESVEHINRIARVVAAPSFTPLKEGDSVIIHHNICRKRNGMKGGLVESDFHVEKNTYFVPLAEVFMYKREVDWIALTPFCFVEPIVDETKQIGSIIVANSGNTYKGMISHEGVMKYSNPLLNQYGIEDGDKIAFSADSEYEFMVNGKLLYKMKVNDILGKFD